ncbi:MAG: hypothetical protein KAS63_00505 [Candidatus Heimdallarchaeota archaeon]|nr:hypothetical protein [Candidatus Heimdallarchaeota archaeon]MCK4953823.1 hypothetical protein [Candidatus Heimdallarchaeota archaeon]
MRVMTEKPISIEELFKEFNIQPHDLEYILNFMQKENISPQLAMRRIKLFEKLQEKMEQAQSDDKVQELTSELDHLSKVVEDLQTERDALQNEKIELDKEIEDTRLQQDLFNAEREELKLQMHALMDSIDTIESETGEEGDQLGSENQELKKRISIMTAGCQTLKDRIAILGSESPALSSLVQDIEKSLSAVMDARQIPTETTFSVPKEIIATSIQSESSSAKVTVQAEEKVTETISPDQVKFVTSSPVSESKPVSTEIERKAPVVIATPPSSSSTPVIKEKLFDEPEEIKDEVVSEEPKVEPKPAAQPEPEPAEEPKKVKVDAKPTDEKEVSPKIEKILRLFISYAGQADSDENWKARVAAICDMDEAYIELGGLAMSQIYAYQTQSLKKKKEFERLINSWIENGLPR